MRNSNARSHRIAHLDRPDAADLGASSRWRCLSVDCYGKTAQHINRHAKLKVCNGSYVDGDTAMFVELPQYMCIHYAQAICSLSIR